MGAIEAETLSDHWAAEAAVRARKHSESVKEAVFEAGELVLLTQPFYEKGLGAILPQADGPYLVTRVPSAHTVILAGPMSGEPIQGGRPLSASPFYVQISYGLARTRGSRSRE